jgi:hypothetical protein
MTRSINIGVHCIATVRRRCISHSDGCRLGTYRLRFVPDGQSLEWLTMDDEGDVVLSEEPDVTPFMRLQNMLLAPLVPEQQL